MAGTSPKTELDRLFADLTEEQAEATRHTDGPLLVLAGAGCGKTRVITRRAAHLALTVTPAHKVLAITFTNKAANEMRERVMALGVGREMTVCTFHSLCARLLRTHHRRAGLPPDFTIFDTADQRKVIKEALVRAQLNNGAWTPALVQSVISSAKNAMQTASDYEATAHDWGQKTLARIYHAYEAVLAQQHGVDFDDLLLKLALLLRSDEELRHRIEARYSHVLIDEYQDTNSAQYEIAHLITERQQNLCATGDPDQSIYGWRGADIGNILRFEEDHPDATVVRLERNYRSTKCILSAASAVIENNIHRKEKTLWTENPEGRAVRVVSLEDGDEEARYIAREVAERTSGGFSHADVAVFYRVNAMSRPIEEALIKAGVPYQVARGTAFYNRKEVKDVLAYARILINPYDEVSLVRAINTPTRGIGKTTVDRLTTAARSMDRPLFEVVADLGRVDSLKKAALTRVARFAALLESLKPLLEGSPRHALEQIISQSGIQADLAKMAEFDPEPLQNVEELVNAATSFEEHQPEGTLRDWLEYTSLLGDVDAVEDESGKVTLMTLHAAKGLEFPVVYMIGLEDGVLPFVRSGREDECDLEEERRLCFVGMTRSKSELNLLHVDYRMARGMSERKMESPFLEELPRDKIEWIEVEESADDGPGRARRGFTMPEDLDEWQVGSLVRHPDYDLGQIVLMHRNGARISVHVQFQNGAEKSFVLPFATELERVDFDEVG